MASCTIRHRTDEWIEVVLGTPTWAGELVKAHRSMIAQLGLEDVVTDDDVYQVIVGDDEIILRARRPKSGVPSFTGVVQDMGGGLVTILVDRDTQNYPHKGEQVRVEPFCG